MKRAVSPETSAGVGLFLLTVGVLGCWVVATRFEWLRRTLPFLCHWGKGTRRWPASKEGVLLGAMMCVFLGLALVAELFWPAITRYLAGLVALLFIFAIPVGARDYRNHRRSVGGK